MPHVAWRWQRRTRAALTPLGGRLSGGAGWVVTHGTGCLVVHVKGFGACGQYGLRFDVNCSILFTELPLVRRAAAAKAAGFGGVEFWWPWAAMVPSDAEADAFVRARSGMPGLSWFR